MSHSSSISGLSPRSPYRVVAAFDFSQLSDRVLEEAMLLCETRRPAELHVVVVGWTEPSGIRMPGAEGPLLSQPAAEQAVCDRVSAAVMRVTQGGTAMELERVAVYVAHGEPAERICALAGSIDADMIVLGTHSRSGVARWVLGSVAEQVVRRAECGVWVLRPRGFLAGEPLPDIAAPLQQGEHALQPFHHRPTYHYLPRADRTAGRVMPIG